MTNREALRFRIAWVSLAVIGVAVLVFGLVLAIVPDSASSSYMRADAAASIGMGLFGLMITVFSFRRREQWAWLTLWYYPLFWAAHLLGGLPPGQDHIHQVIFILLSVLGLLLSVPAFFPRH